MKEGEALERSRDSLVCVECGRIDRGERGWTLPLDIDDELVSFCPACDAQQFGCRDMRAES
jgi:hypothetical protein